MTNFIHLHNADGKPIMVNLELVRDISVYAGPIVKYKDLTCISFSRHYDILVQETPEVIAASFGHSTLERLAVELRDKLDFAINHYINTTRPDL